MAFLAPALPMLGAALLGGGVAYGMSQAGKKSGGGSTSAPAPMKMPEAPKAAEATAKAEETAQRRMAQRKKFKSVYTSPLGAGGEADVARKTLLGQ